MFLIKTYVPVRIALSTAIWLGVISLFLFATVDTYRSSWSVAILPRQPECFYMAFHFEWTCLIAWWHFLILPLLWPQWRYFRLLPIVQLSSTIVNTQIMSCRHFALKYCNSTMNFTKISSITCGTILVKHIKAWNSESVLVDFRF